MVKVIGNWRKINTTLKNHNSGNWNQNIKQNKEYEAGKQQKQHAKVKPDTSTQVTSGD